MTDPKRWSDDGGELSPAERRLLRAGLTPSVPRGAKRAVWVGLAAQLPSAIAAATTASAGTGGVASALATVSLLKAAGVGVLLGATTITAVTVVEHRRPAAPAPASHAIAMPALSAPASSEENPPSAPAPSVPPEAAPPSTALPETRPGRPRAPDDSPSAAGVPPPARSVATFPDETGAPQRDAESRQIATARNLLRVGDPRTAYVELERARHEFPNGALSQEREALTIEALRELGQSAEARRRAQAFLARYPASPHAPIARRALE